jgi:hypothetical protein
MDRYNQNTPPTNKHHCLNTQHTTSQSTTTKRQSHHEHRHATKLTTQKTNPHQRLLNVAPNNQSCRNRGRHRDYSSTPRNLRNMRHRWEASTLGNIQIAAKLAASKQARQQSLETLASVFGATRVPPFTTTTYSARNMECRMEQPTLLEIPSQPKQENNHTTVPHRQHKILQLSSSNTWPHTNLYKDPMPPSNLNHHYPLTPTILSPNKLSVFGLSLLTAPPNILQQPTQQPLPHIPASHTPPGLHKTFLYSHTVHEYEQQSFSWRIQQQSDQNITQGPVQFLQSRHCSSTRGGLIGILHALQALQDCPSSPPPPQTTIIIHCRDKKLLNSIQLTRRNHYTTNPTLIPEHNLIPHTLSRTKLTLCITQQRKMTKTQP